MIIKVDDLSGPEIAAFLEDHIRDMRSVSPPESKHALDLDGLRAPEITFWTAWEENLLIGCCALKDLGGNHAEMKSMRVSAESRGRGIGVTLMNHILREAKEMGHQRLSLETGSMAFFEPARKLYEKFHFKYCGPFGPYKEDANSVFMTREI